MDLTVICDDNVIPLHLSPTTTIQSIKSMVSTLINTPPNKFTLLYQSRTTQDSDTLISIGCVSNDVLQVRRQSSPSVSSFEQIPQELWGNPAALQEFIKASPHLMQQLLRANPTFAEAVMSDSPEFLNDILTQQAESRRRAEHEEQKRVAALNADPFNLDAQKRIEEEIRQKNVQENMEAAIENNPESFGRVIMLYINMEVNDKPLKAFVDSGAQSTIMSKECAERCGILRLLDIRFAGIAKGVGSAKILGRVHAVKLKIGKTIFVSSFTILEDQSMDFLFGLDQLKRHQAIIDLKDNVLRIGGEVAPFLSEKDIPESAKELSMEPLREMKNSNPNNAVGNNNKPAPSSSSSPSISSPPSQPRVQQSSSSVPLNVNRSPAPQPRPSAPPTAVTSSPRPTTTSSGTNPSTSPFPESSIQQVMNLGFSRQEVISALQMTGGNADMAASYLMQL